MNKKLLIAGVLTTILTGAAVAAESSFHVLSAPDWPWFVQRAVGPGPNGPFKTQLVARLGKGGCVTGPFWLFDDKEQPVFELTAGASYPPGCNNP